VSHKHLDATSLGFAQPSGARLGDFLHTCACHFVPGGVRGVMSRDGGKEIIAMQGIELGGHWMG
jgi:hypothetical protein